MSRFSKRFTELSGIVSLMEDLGDALNQQPELIFMGGGNPAHIPEVENCLSEHVQALAKNPSVFHKLIGEYQPPQGDPECLAALADYFSKAFHCQLSAENIAISNGGQSAFFTLFNMLAGYSDAEDHSDSHPKGMLKRVLLPMVPDYLGYADTGLDAAMFQTLRPVIQEQEPPFFKYKIDFDALKLDKDIAAVCLSRPANPSANLVTDAEIEELKRRCRDHNIPLIIDLAYGKPFPNVTFVENHLEWDENCIFVMSLSKLGMPGVRTGIVIAAAATIKRLSRATASLSLAPSNLGPTLCKSCNSLGRLKDAC